MNFLSTGLHKIWGFFVEGKGFRSTPKYLWDNFWDETDRLFGIFCRWILRIKTPIDPNKVFFHTQESKYTCNPKYICEELRKQCPEIEIVWRAPGKGRGGIPDDIKIARLNRFVYFQELFSSKVVVTNSFLYLGQPYSLKKKQVLIETWHGSLGIKRHDQKAIKDTWRRVHALKETGRMTTYCITNSSLETGSLSSTYWPKTPMLEYGHARNDIFFPRFAEKRAELRAALFEKWELPPGTKTVMYGPTFRDAKNFDCYDVDFERLTKTLSERFGGTWAVLLRYHPSLAKEYKKRGYQINEEEEGKEPAFLIRNVTDYIDMQELIAVTDVAITDYSSWIYDFVLMRKPGFIFATDIKEYNNERGFYYPLEETPFPIAVNNDELMDNIMAFDNESYQARVEQFLKDKGCVEDGHASERVVELIKKIIREEEAKVV